MAGGVLVAGFLTWLLIRIIAAPTNLNLSNSYMLPDFISLKDLEDLDYTSSYAVAIDGEEAVGKNENEIRPTASTAKMILGLALMKKKPFNVGESGENIIIDENFYQIYVDYYNNGGSVSKVSIGEEISEYDALASVFLASSNNMADTLAIWAFGSLEEYRTYAIDMLMDFGIYNVNIGVDASGFDASTTATAVDLAKIGEKVMLDPVLSEIVGLNEYEVPVAGVLQNTNKILGISNISGVKTGYIGEDSGYCLISAYKEDDHIITVALLNAKERSDSFNESLSIVNQIQNKIMPVKLISAGDTVGYYESWWNGKNKIVADEDLTGIGWAEAFSDVDLEMNRQDGALKIMIGSKKYEIKVSAANYNPEPNFFERIKYAFGWKKDVEENYSETEKVEVVERNIEESETIKDGENNVEDLKQTPITNAPSSNCTIGFGRLMLINPNFMVDSAFISARRSELVSISSLYGIVEGNQWNGDNLLDPEAAIHINDMVKAYEAEYPGHTLETRSCFRSVGTKCGRLCAETGASDHHTGLTCDLLDPVYGTELDTDYLAQHIDWQWLKANSYKYGFIDRFPEAWAGGPMSEPLNVDENGSTGLFETWHYRYVGIPEATEIATGKYNNGQYDSLEHYLKARRLINDLKNGTCK